MSSSIASGARGAGIVIGAETMSQLVSDGGGRDQARGRISGDTASVEIGSASDADVVDSQGGASEDGLTGDEVDHVGAGEIGSLPRAEVVQGDIGGGVRGLARIGDDQFDGHGERWRESSVDVDSADGIDQGADFGGGIREAGDEFGVISHSDFQGAGGARGARMNSLGLGGINFVGMVDSALSFRGDLIGAEEDMLGFGGLEGIGHALGEDAAGERSSASADGGVRILLAIDMSLIVAMLDFVEAFAADDLIVFIVDDMLEILGEEIFVQLEAQVESSAFGGEGKGGFLGMNGHAVDLSDHGGKLSARMGVKSNGMNDLESFERTQQRICCAQGE